MSQQTFERKALDVRGDGSNAEAVRRHNLSTVLRRVHGTGPVTRAELTTLTGLNRSTVGVLVNDLAARGLVRETKPQHRGRPGRPSPLVSPCGDGAVVLACDIEVDSVAVAVVGIGGKVVDRVRTDRLSGYSPEQTLARLAELARRRLADTDERRLVGVGVALVGVTRRRDGYLHVAPNLGWQDVPVAELLAEQLGLDVPVRAGNEADLGARAEHVRGAGAGVDNLVYVSGEVGIGGGVIVDGRPLTGGAGYAGEIGHVPVNPTGLTCRCGSVGCWETEAGEEALLRHSAHPDRTRAGTSIRHAVQEVLAAAAAGDARAVGAVQAVGGWLGVGLAGLTNVFNPERVVLGGFLAALHPLVADVLARELAGRTIISSLAPVEVVPSALGVDSPLIGAAELALEPTLADPTTVPPVVEAAPA